MNQKPLNPKDLKKEIVKRNLMRNAVMHSATCTEYCELGYYGSLHECPYENCMYYEGRLDGLMFDN